MHPDKNSMLVIIPDPIKHFFISEIFFSFVKILKRIKKHTPPITAIIQCVYLLHSISIKQYEIPLAAKIAISCLTRLTIHHQY